VSSMRRSSRISSGRMSLVPCGIGLLIAVGSFGRRG
jgi:hypothetical protein